MSGAKNTGLAPAWPAGGVEGFGGCDHTTVLEFAGIMD